MSEKIVQTFSALGKAMRTKDADEIKLKRDALEREQAKKATEEAKEKTGEEK